MSPYEALADAVVLEAVEEYRAAYRKRRKGSETYKVKRDMKAIENFFHSQQFSLFSNLDGSALLSRIQKELEEEE